MALTKITSRILDSSGVTILGTIATGVWQGTPINQTYLVGQSGTNTGDETLARINALDVTELGTISSGVWQGSVIAEAYLQNQSGTNTGDQTTISGNAGSVTNGVYTVGNQTIGGVKTFSGGGIFSSSSQGKLKLVASSNEYLSLEFANASGATQWEISKNNTQDLYFYKGGYRMMLKADGKVGIGTTSPNAKLKVEGNAATNGLSIKSAGNGGTYPFMVTWSGGSEGDAFCVNDSLNVGIGTTSPSAKLNVNSAADVGIPALGANGGSFKDMVANVRGLIAGNGSGGDYYMQVQRTDGDTTAYDLLLQPNGGNVGIGTTSPVKTLDVQGQLAISNSASSYWYLDRNDSSGNFDIINDSNQVKLSISSGGNVGIGQSIPTNPLHIKDTTNGFVGLRLEGSENYLGSDWTLYASSVNAPSSIDFFGIYNNNASNGATAGYKFKIDKFGASTFSSTITTSGEVQSPRFTAGTYPYNSTLGSGADASTTTIESGSTTGYRSAIKVNGGGSGSPNTIEFTTVSVPRMRIKNDGVVDCFFTIQSAGNQRFGGGPAHGNSSNPGITTKANGTAGVYWNSNGSGGWGGGTFTTNNSDRNMKTNIIPMDINALNVIGSLETKYFNWTEKSNKGDTTIRQAGIIAQDLKELMPEGVFGTEWDDEDEDTNGLSLNSNATTALFIKAIQEQQAQIELLKQEVELLKQ